jgi:hypothetical protein
MPTFFDGQKKVLQLGLRNEEDILPGPISNTLERLIFRPQIHPLSHHHHSEMLENRLDLQQLMETLGSLPSWVVELFAD